MKRQPHIQPDRAKDPENRHQHRIRERKIPGLIILLQQQYPKEHTNNKHNETRNPDIQQRSLLCNGPNQQVEHTIKPSKQESTLRVQINCS
ncbi:hypothetical protein C5S53_00030 [Methanophagales archaeon]|nr:hypothetical protein C5S53_00030 [Methanophagales archaeon]